MIWPFAILLGTLVLKLGVDLWQFYHKRKINHALEAVPVAILLAIAALVLSRWNVKSAVLPFVMFLFIFWALMDTLWNLFVGNKLTYTGDTAFLDKLQNKYPFVKAVKYIGAGLSILFFILTYGLLLFELPIYGN